MAKIIGVTQVKGGAGRSTLATNLASEFSKIGKPTAPSLVTLWTGYGSGSISSKSGWPRTGSDRRA